jgi:hypothetical protein
MRALLVLLLVLAGSRRKRKPQTEDPQDEPVETAPEYGKVWYPEPKKWSHYIGRTPHALVAFIKKDDAGMNLSAIMERVIELIDRSKLNIVVAEEWKIGQIIEEQGVTEFPSIRFYRSGMKRWSTVYDGFPSPKGIAKWAMDQVRELDEWDHLKDEDAGDEEQE